MLAFDIETHGRWDDVPPRLQAYLTRRDEHRGRAPDDARAAAQTVSLYPGLARVVAVGLWDGAGPGEALSLVPDLGAATDRVEGAPVVHRFREEADLLRTFWARAAAARDGRRRLVSFNGRGFDGPVLAIRSAVLGVRPSVDLVGDRRALWPHCDVSEVLSFFGAVRERLSLDYWCGVFGLASPKAAMDGGDVAATFEGGDYPALARYACADARAAGELFAALAPTLLAAIADGGAEGLPEA